MTPEPSFHAFLERLRQGDDPAVRLLYERFATRLHAVAHRALGLRLRGKVDTDDVLNSALRSLCLRLGEGQFALGDWDSLGALLVTITLRKCGRWRAYFGAAKRDVGLEHPLDAATGPTRVALEPAAGADPAEALVLQEAVEEMSRGLDPEQREMVCLAMDGHEAGEISERLACGYHRVWRTLRLVRQRLERMRDQAQDDLTPGGAPA